MRSHPPEANLAFVRDLEANGVPDGLVAVDLAGPEERFPDPTIHREAIDLARAIGLHVTAHAGEWGGAAQVRRTLVIDPERIAHGPLAIDDPDLVAELIRRGTWLDLCPTSNVQARIVPTLEDHPLLRLKRAGVPVTLNTDDLTVSDISLSDEYERAVCGSGSRSRSCGRSTSRPSMPPSATARPATACGRRSGRGAQGSRSSSRPSGRGPAS